MNQKLYVSLSSYLKNYFLNQSEITVSTILQAFHQENKREVFELLYDLKLALGYIHFPHKKSINDSSILVMLNQNSFKKTILNFLQNFDYENNDHYKKNGFLFTSLEMYEFFNKNEKLKFFDDENELCYYLSLLKNDSDIKHTRQGYNYKIDDFYFYNFDNYKNKFMQIEDKSVNSLFKLIKKDIPHTDENNFMRGILLAPHYTYLKKNKHLQNYEDIVNI